MKVFLGGTCNESTWRDYVIQGLELAGVDYFNPVVEDWTEECMAEELRQRELCDLCLYVITPLKTGDYAIAEVVDDSNKRPGKTVFCFLCQDAGKRFTDGQIRSLTQVGRMVENNGGVFLSGLEEVLTFIETA